MGFKICDFIFHTLSTSGKVTSSLPHCLMFPTTVYGPCTYFIAKLMGTSGAEMLTISLPLHEIVNPLLSPWVVSGNWVDSGTWVDSHTWVDSRILVDS